MTVRHDWTFEEIVAIHSLPLLDLLWQAQAIHRATQPSNEVQGCVLLNIKTGGCPEDCAYCPQSAHYHTGVARPSSFSVDEAIAAARRARAHGRDAVLHGRRVARRAGRRGVRSRSSTWCAVVRALGMEACCTLGMLTQRAGRRARRPPG